MNIQDFYPIYKDSHKVTIDSRNIEGGDVFFAFSGANFNAATLAEEAIKKGALAVIVEDEKYANPKQNIFYVPSTLVFLQELAKYHRSQLNIPIIALTGSNGKTTTKELIHAVLSQKYNVQYTRGNYNNHIGVPLTLLSIKPEHQMAVIEMGANHQQEIAELCRIAEPNFGYITNFGKAHLEGFGGVEGVIKGKSEMYDFLMSNDRFVLINENDSIQVEKTDFYDLIIPFGKKDSEFYFEKITQDNRVGIVYEDIEALSQLTGDYNFTNLCAAASLGLYFNIDFIDIKKAIEEYTPVNMRSQVVQKEGKKLVLDTYNANPSSMKVALENFNLFNGSKTVIIGDMLELGEEAVSEHSAILKLAKELHFDHVITVGPHFKEVNPKGISFANTQDLIEYLKENKVTTENVLLKGSRGIALEKALEFI